MSGKEQNINAKPPRPEASAGQGADLAKMAPILKDDRIRGNPNTPVKIVEYKAPEKAPI